MSALAALGITGTQLPSFNPVGGEPSGAAAVGSAIDAVSRAVVASQARKKDAEALKAYSEAEKARSEASAVQRSLNRWRQTEIVNRIIRANRESIHGTESVPVQDIRGLTADESGRYPMFVKAYDNRGSEPGGEMWILHPELAEGMEGLGPLGMALGGNILEAPVTQEDRDRSMKEFLDWLTR